MLKKVALVFLVVLSILNLTCQTTTDTGFQKTSDGTECIQGQHLDDDKCVSNNDWCNTYDKTAGNCSDCSKWTWKQNNQKQGDYCATKWWAWVLIFLGSLLLAGLIAAAIWYCCCFNHGKKKTSRYGNEMENLDHQYDRADYGYEKNVRGGNYRNDGYQDGYNRDAGYGNSGYREAGYDEIH